MPLTFEEARALTPGTLLTFGDNPAVYRVEWVSVNKRGELRMNLTREDGYDTHATHHDLDVAQRVATAPPASASVTLDNGAMPNPDETEPPAPPASVVDPGAADPAATPEPENAGNADPSTSAHVDPQAQKLAPRKGGKPDKQA